MKRTGEDCKIDLHQILNIKVGERMLTNNLIWSVILFLIQPIFIIGSLYAFFNYKKRVGYSRETYRVNFIKKNVELKNYFLKGIIPGILLSVLVVFLGIPVTIEWYLVYQLIAIILLLVGGSRLIHPIFTFSLSGLMLYGLHFFGINLPMNRLNKLINQEIFTLSQHGENLPQLMMNLLLIAVLILFISTFLMNKARDYTLYPILENTKRGKKIAKFQKKSLWLLPLFVLVPGEVIEPFAAWWPLLSINGNQYAFLFLPILVGFHYTVSTQLLEDATSELQKEFRYLAILGLALFAISYFLPIISIIGMLFLMLGGLFILVRHRRRESLWTFRYGPADEGMRVIAVRNESPAERMNLSIGDIILEINDYELINTSEYNKILAENRSYIKMRVRRKDGEIIITETPLYDDDSNNLGLLLLEK